MKNNRPKVGVGVIIVNEKGKILVGKRIGNLAPYYSIPGGHLEEGETFETAAIKEVKEETDLTILHPKVIAVTNNLTTYQQEGKHYISVNLLATVYTGQVKTMEPQKCVSWEWVDPHHLPQPHFDASAFAIECYLNDVFYIENQK